MWPKLAEQEKEEVASLWNYSKIITDNSEGVGQTLRQVVQRLTASQF